MQAVVGRPSGSFGSGYSAARSVWLAAALAVVGLIGVGVWSLTGTGSGDGSATVAGGVVDSDPQIIALATTSRAARMSAGDGFAGSWVDADGRLQVAGTSADALAGLAADGVSVRVSAFSVADLNAVVHALNADALSTGSRLPGLSSGWSVNVVQNRVDVETADPNAVVDALRSIGVDERMVGFVDPVERRTLQRDGLEIYEEFSGFAGWAGWSTEPSPGIGCSMGAPVVGGFISAAHCALNGGVVGFVGTPGTVGRVEQSLQSQHYDGVFVRLDAPHTVDPVVPATGGAGSTPILGVAEAPVGTEVCKVGLKTGRTCGRILSRNFTDTAFAYYGLIRTDLCADQGDSGGVLMWGNQIQGVLSSGSIDGDCGSNYTPINYLLDTFNVDLMTQNGPVPHLDNYERVATSIEEAGGLALPGAGATPSTTTPIVVVPDLPGPGGGAGDIPVLPAADAPAPAQGGVADIPVLPAADPPATALDGGDGDIPVLPGENAPAPAGGDIPVLPAAEDPAAGTIPVLPAADAVPVLPGLPRTVDRLTPTTLPVLPAAVPELPPTVPVLPAPVPTLPAPVPELPAPVPELPAPVPELPAPVPSLPAVGSQPFNTNLLVNGSFESVILPDDTLSHVPQAGWASTRPGNIIETWEGTYLQVGATDGRHLIELNGDAADSISQTIAVVPGARYQWSFDHRGRFDADMVTVFVNGRAVHSMITQPGAWVTYSGEYTPQAGETTLTFTLTAQDPGSIGNLIDNVQLVRIG